MRFLFKTHYAQDLQLFEHNGQRFWYGLLALALLATPWLASGYWLSQMIFIFIYAIVGLGLMLLAGYTGQMSIGHAAFMAVGAYTEAVLAARGWPFPLTLLVSAGLSAAAGVIVGLPALRLRGLYLAVATLAFGFIIEELIARWDSVTGGNAGMRVRPIELLGLPLRDGTSFYYLCLALVVLALFLIRNLLRTPTGRAFVAIRDSDVSAQSMGVALARTKTLAFALSAALAGLGGALYARRIGFISPEQFTVVQSIELVTMIVIGGLGSLHGVFLGAAFVIALPQLIALAKDFLPAAVAGSAGLQPVVFGLVLMGFLLFEPQGLYSRWLKVRTWLELFPYYRRGMFARQRSFQKSERAA
jgi:branched-chain amino acid transport system permease protein